MMRILVAEDDPHTRTAVVELLLGEGHLVFAAADGHEARHLLDQESFDLLCLDVMMPRLSGYDVCRHVRAQDPHMPIMFLTAKADEIDKVVGLELGADDYIVKPFGSKEFLARVRALTRRTQARLTSELTTEDDADAPFQLGPWRICPRELRGHWGEQTVELTAREVRLLRMLTDHPGEVVSRRRLFNCGWGLQHVPNSRTLDQTISQLRKRLESTSEVPRLIQTVYGIGYRYDPL